MTAYSITPVGADGLEEERTERIPGPLPRDAVSVARLHMEIARLRQRLEDECALRTQAQDRLSKCARVLAVLAHVYPELRGVVRRAREDIWPEVEG